MLEYRNATESDSGVQNLLDIIFPILPMQRFVDTPAEYLALVPAEQLPLVEHFQKLIVQVAPRAEAKIGYGMLIFADPTGDLFALAAQKHYVGLYVSPTEALEMMTAELADVDHGKCCLRFKRLDQVPTATIKKLLKLALSLREEAKPKEAATKKAGSRKTKAPAKRKTKGK